MRPHDISATQTLEMKRAPPARSDGNIACQVEAVPYRSQMPPFEPTAEPVLPGCTFRQRPSARRRPPRRFPDSASPRSMGCARWRFCLSSSVTAALVKAGGGGYRFWVIPAGWASTYSSF